MNNIENQDFEIIALQHPDYIERMKAIDEITDFSTLEQIFVSDEYVTVRAKSFDKLTELYSDTSKYKKMIKGWHEISGFVPWIHFMIEKLRRNNNIEKTISYILEKNYGYWNNEMLDLLETIKKDKLFKKEYRYHRYIKESRNKIFQKVVDVMLLPIKPVIKDDYILTWDKSLYWNGSTMIQKSTGIETRRTDYGIQYHYEMVIKILQEKENNQLDYDYVYIKAWNSHFDTHERLFNEINYTKKEVE